MAKRPKITKRLVDSLHTTKPGGERTYCGATAGFVSRWEHGKHPLDSRAVKLLGVMVLESVGDRPGLEYLRSLVQKREPRDLARRLPALQATSG